MSKHHCCPQRKTIRLYFQATVSRLHPLVPSDAFFSRLKKAAKGWEKSRRKATSYRDDIGANKTGWTESGHRLRYKVGATPRRCVCVYVPAEVVLGPCWCRRHQSSGRV